MIFRRTPPPATHELRLRALGRLLDQRGYSRDGLCILAIEDGFAVSGLRVPTGGAGYGLVEGDELVEAAELAAEPARGRRASSPGERRGPWGCSTG